MRIAAAICWYDEPVDTLQRVIASVAPLVDRVVAMDGAWKGFPHDDPRSPYCQSQAISEACERHLIDLHDASLPAMLPSQAFKRSLLYRIASTHADWILVIDADEQLVIENPARLRRIIRSRDVDAVNIRVSTPGSKMDGGGLTATAPGGNRWQPRLLRSDSSITVGPHSHRTLTTDDLLIQCGGEQDAALHIDLRSAQVGKARGLSIINNTHSRDAQRMAAKQAYGKARFVSGID